MIGILNRDSKDKGLRSDLDNSGKNASGVLLADFYTKNKRLSWSLVFLSACSAVFGSQLVIGSHHTKANQIEVTASSSNSSQSPASGSGLSLEPEATDSSEASGSSASQSVNSNTDTTLVVNGENVALPQDGSMHKTISGNDGNTSIDVNIDNGNKTGNNRQTINTYTSKDRSSTSVNIRSSNNSTIIKK